MSDGVLGLLLIVACMVFAAAALKPAECIRERVTIGGVVAIGDRCRDR